MTSIQYVGDSHTLVLLPGEFVKRKVVNGEIIEVEHEKTISSLLSRGFALVNGKSKELKVEVVNDGKDDITVEVTNKKKSK